MARDYCKGRQSTSLFEYQLFQLPVPWRLARTREDSAISGFSTLGTGEDSRRLNNLRLHYPRGSQGLSRFRFWYPREGPSHFSFWYPRNSRGLSRFSFQYPRNSRGLSHSSFWYPGGSRGLKSYQPLVSATCHGGEYEVSCKGT